MPQATISLHRNHRIRHGISLLEIMVSIGVLSVGLLGVLALMPAASNQAKIGAQQDAAALLARRAFREMNVRWRDNDAIGLSGADPFFLVDPLGGMLKQQFYPTLAQAGIINVTGPGSPGKGYDYPDFTTVVSANRALLRKVPHVDLIAPIGGVNGPDPLPNVVINEIFRSKDDLFFGEFASRENPAPNPPQQVAIKNEADTPVAVKRFASGNLSWFSTVVGRNTGFSTVSVAIVEKRTGEEFVAEINFDTTTRAGFVATSGGIGEIQIPLVNAPQENWDNVKSGHWILLANAQAVTGGSPPSTVGTAEWYRVQGSGTVDVDNDGTDDHRVFSVAGPNWNAAFVDGPTLGAFNVKTYAILIPNVIAVHSRNLPL